MSRRALVVTNGRSRGALAAVRGLRQGGWDVGVGTPDGEGMVTRSRACTTRHVVPRPRGDGAAFVDAVRSAVATGRYDVVFGGGDDWTAALATYRAHLPVTVAHPAAGVVAAGLDKLGLVERARAVGIAAPHTVEATPEALAGWSGPAVVKCRAHWEPGSEHLHRVEARRLPDAAGAARRVAELTRAGFPAVLQEPVDGDLGALIGLVHDGRLRGRVQQRTTGLWPTPSGVSCRAQTVPVDEDLAARATRLLAGLGWSGLVELQFLRDRTGAHHLIDLNGRFYGSMALANAAGPNLAHAWACQALGLPLPPLPDGRPGVRFVWGAGDLRRAVAERRGGLLRDVGSTLRALPRSTTSVWQARDPGPTLELVAGRLRAPAVPDVAEAPARVRSSR